MLVHLLDNIYIRFGAKLYKKNVGIPMGTNCSPLLLMCFCFAMRGTSCSLTQRKNGITPFTQLLPTRVCFTDAGVNTDGEGIHKLRKHAI